MKNFTLVGRRDEFQSIRECWQECRNDSRGFFLFLVGEAGVGKTALLNQIVADAQVQEDFLVLHCECEKTQQSEYFPLVKAIAHFMNSSNSDQSRRRLKILISETFGDFVACVPGLGNAAGIVSKISTLRATGYLPEFVNYDSKTMIVFARFFLALSEKKPTIIAIDDLQWADHDTIALLHFLSESIDSRPLLIMCTIRAEYLTDISVDNPARILASDLIRNQKARRLDLAKFPFDEMDLLVQRFIGSHRFSLEDMKTLYHETEGNPFFLREILFLLQERKTIIQDHGFMVPAGDLGQIIIPRTVKDIIRERIHRLPIEFRRTLDVAAVVGSEFNSGIVNSVIGGNEFELLERLRDLERIYSLVERINDSHKFYHIKIQETLYDELPPNLRKVYHQSIAEYLVGKSSDEFYEMAADHFKEAGNLAEALKYYGTAAQNSFERENFRSTRKISTKLLKISDGPKSELPLTTIKDFRLMRAKANYHLGLYDDCRADLKLILDEGACETRLKAQAYHLKGRACYFLGLRDDCISSYNESLNIAKTLGDNQLTFLNLMSLAAIHDLTGDYIGMEKDYEKATSLADEWGNPSAKADVLLKYGMIIMDEPPKVIPKISEALRIYTELGNPRGIAASHLNLGNEFFYLHNLEEAKNHFERALNIINESEGVEQCYPLNNLSMVYQVQTRFTDAQTALEKALACHLTNYHRIFILNNLANTLRLRGLHAEAIRVLERILPDVDSDCDPVTPETTYYNLGMAYFYAGRYHDAIRNIEKSFVGRRKSNEALIRGKRFKGLSEAYAKLDDTVKAEFCRRKATELLVSDVPDLWYYTELDYEVADLAFYE